MTGAYGMEPPQPLKTSAIHRRSSRCHRPSGSSGVTPWLVPQQRGLQSCDHVASSGGINQTRSAGDNAASATTSLAETVVLEVGGDSRLHPVVRLDLWRLGRGAEYRAVGCHCPVGRFLGRAFLGGLGRMEEPATGRR